MANENPNGPMKIITINVPKTYLKAIGKCVGVFWPSRSEMIRVAIYELLKNMTNFQKELEELDPEVIETKKQFIIDGKIYNKILAIIN